MTPKKLREFRYALFSQRGERIDSLSFYAEGQRPADALAGSWARKRGCTVMRIKQRSTGA